MTSSSVIVFIVIFIISSINMVITDIIIISLALHTARFKFGANVVIQVLFYRFSTIRKECG